MNLNLRDGFIQILIIIPSRLFKQPAINRIQAKVFWVNLWDALIQDLWFWILISINWSKKYLGQCWTKDWGSIYQYKLWVFSEEPWGSSGCLEDFSEILFHLDPLLDALWIFLVMKEITPLAVGTASVFEKSLAGFGFITVVSLSTAPELVGSVCEFTFILVGAEPKLDIFFA